MTWLLDCLSKTEATNPRNHDGLIDVVAAFVQHAGVDLLPRIVAGLNNLLDTPPIIERHCEISQRFGRLIRAAGHAIENLIVARHPASLENDALAILHKFSMSRHSDIGDHKQEEFQFSALVPQWPELNRACFWYQAEKTREGFDKKNGAQLTEIWQVGLYGSFWKFDESDLDYSIEQITIRSSNDEKQLALSLAFNLYVLGGRDRKMRASLKKSVSADATLADRLQKYFKPKAQGRQRLKEMERKYRRRSEVHKQKETKRREEWQTYLRANVDKLRNNGLKAGQLSNPQWYLHESTREKNDRTGRWTNGDWKYLTEEFGEEVARAYRDGVVRFWREYRPKLRSEGAPANSTPIAVIFGLTGLQIEANETSGWAHTLQSCGTMPNVLAILWLN